MSSGWRSLLLALLALNLGAAQAVAESPSSGSTQGVIHQVGPYIPSAFWVRVRNFTNATCDESNRLLIEFAEQNYQSKLFAMALKAYHTGAPVYFDSSISGGQCRVTRMIPTGSD